MNLRHIALGLGTAAGALLAAALLPIAVASADDYAPEPLPAGDPIFDLTSNPFTLTTMPAFGGSGSETVSEAYFANYDTTTSSFVTDPADPNFGIETELITTYSTPFFTDTVQDIYAAQGALTSAANFGFTDETFWFTPFGFNLIGFETNPMELLTPFGDIPL
ncbi:MAG: hypothetical protein ACRDTV_01905 [Mycobacterium sp.]